MRSKLNSFGWFDLSKYAATTQYSLSEWHDEIDTRLIAYLSYFDPKNWEVVGKDYTFVSAGLPPEKIAAARRTLEWIFSIGLISNSKRNDFNEVMKSDEYSPFRKELISIDSEFSWHKELTTSVSSLSADSAFAIVDGKNLIESNIRKEARSFVTKGGLHSREDRRLMAKFSFPLSDFITTRYSPNSRFIEVDFDASDEQILKEFQIWLAHERLRSGELSQRQKMISEAESRTWSSLQILPYFDVKAYAQINNLHVTNAQIANLLFPNEFDVDRVERVRKVVKPKVASLFNFNFLDKLEIQSKFRTK